MGSTIVQRQRTGIDRTQLSERCGCLAKLDGEELACLLREAFDRSDTVGSSDVVQLDDCAAIPAGAGELLASIDFGPLVAPDLFRAGRIAASHALSDVHAMGGNPIAALAMLIVDLDLPEDAGAEAMAGLIDGCAVDGVALLGGHTAVGPEAMVGLTVIGRAGERLISKSGARPGDTLMLSKPLGSGLMLRGFRHGLVSERELEPALASMELSNGPAARAALAVGVSAGTDVTGFGLIGHLAEMLAGSGLGATIRRSGVPVLPGPGGLPEALYRSGWIKRNVEYCRSLVDLIALEDQVSLGLLADPQTSGGLLVSTSSPDSRALREAGFRAIGTVKSDPGMEIVR